MEDSFGRNYKSSLFNKNSKAKQARYLSTGMSTMDEIKKAVSVLRETVPEKLRFFTARRSILRPFLM